MLPSKSIILAIFKCFQQVFAALNCDYINILTLTNLGKWSEDNYPGNYFS